MRSGRGVGNIGIYPLWRDNPAQVHPDVPPLQPSVRWRHPLSINAILACVRMLIKRPRRYLSSLALIMSELPKQPRRVVTSLALFPVIVSMAEDLERNRIRHVHAHFASYPTLAALIVHRLTGISYSFTAHAFDLYVNPSHLPNKVSDATFIVTISEYNQRLLQPLRGQSYADTRHPLRRGSPNGVAANMFWKPGNRLCRETRREKGASISHRCLRRSEAARGYRSTVRLLAVAPKWSGYVRRSQHCISTIASISWVRKRRSEFRSISRTQQCSHCRASSLVRGMLRVFRSH